MVINGKILIKDYIEECQWKKASKNKTIIRKIIAQYFLLPNGYLLFQFYQKSFQEIIPENNQKETPKHYIMSRNIVFQFTILKSTVHHHYRCHLGHTIIHIIYYSFIAFIQRNEKKKSSLFNIYQHKHGNTTHLISCCDKFQKLLFSNPVSSFQYNVSIVITI